jgi:hypothetical protein
MSDIPNSKYFGKHADGRMANELFKTNRPEYDRRRGEAERDGLLAPKPEWARTDYRKKFEPKQFTESELQILAQVPESETNRYYRSPSNGATDTLAKLASEQPEHYAKVRAAAVLRSLVPASQGITQPEPRPTNNFFRLSDEITKEAGLPIGFETNDAGFATVLKVIADRREQKRIEEERTVKAEAQKAKDAAVDESLATVGHIRKEA